MMPAAGEALEKALPDLKALPVDQDVRDACADYILQGSHHESVMPIRRNIEGGEMDDYPVIQGMQFMKNRLAGKQA